MDYYTIPKQLLGSDGKLPIAVRGGPGEVFYEAALDMVETIAARNRAGLDTVFICPVGPVGQYPIFVRLVNERAVSLRRVWFINMDEYLDEAGAWIDARHPLSFRGFMARNVYARIEPELLMPEEQRVFPDPADPGALTRLIGELGGVDVCYGGIGITGHLAFNEPEPVSPEEFSARTTRVLRISPETRTINAAGDLGGAVEAMPEFCVTLGMREILAAKRVRLYCFRDWHRAVVRRAAYGERSSLFPVTLLQGHPDALVTVSENVADPPYAYPL